MRTETGRLVSLLGLLLMLGGCALSQTQNPALTEDPLTYQFQVNWPYYDKLGFGFGGQANRRLSPEHHISAGLSTNLQHVNVGKSPAFYLADTTEDVGFWLLSMPILHRYRIYQGLFTPYSIVGAMPSIGGPLGQNFVHYERFVTGFHLEAIAGLGLWYAGLSIELRGYLPLTDPYERPINPPEFKAHPHIALVVGF
jgi:hypothetical protein